MFARFVCNRMLLHDVCVSLRQMFVLLSFDRRLMIFDIYQAEQAAYFQDAKAVISRNVLMNSMEKEISEKMQTLADLNKQIRRRYAVSIMNQRFNQVPKYVSYTTNHDSQPQIFSGSPAFPH